MTETASTPAPRPFVRPRDGRLLGGVCAGIAAYAGIDPLLVRIGAVVLTAFGGAGVLAYAALWALTPSTDGPPPLDLRRSAYTGRPLPRWVPVALGAAAVLVVLAHLPGLALLALLGLLVAAVATRAGRRLLAALVLLVVVLVGSAVALGGSLGSRSYTVSSPADLGGHYSVPAGRLRLDLSQLSGPVDRTVRADVGRGDLVVLVPATLPVRVHARVGVGAVHVLGRSASGVAPAEALTTGGAGTPLRLDLTTGVGTVTVESAG